ncbi:hypothetical protein LUZ60_009267 [Juncus effusus]|nr:hypothetical protein LUZ60_009267 [Juncus effusus]
MDIENGETEIVGVGEGETSIPMDSHINKGVTNSPSKWGIVRKSVGSILESKWRRKMEEAICCLPGVEPQRLIETHTRGSLERNMCYSNTGPSIFDVPDRVKLVPIGPYHSPANRENAIFNVSKKWICAQYLIEYHGLNFLYCLNRFGKEEARIRSYYAESMLPVYTGEVLKELFFIDSCFIWFFIYIMGCDPYRFRRQIERANSVDWLQNIMDQHVLSDITSNENQIKIELLMLGNQIPWFLLEIISGSMHCLAKDPLKSTLICFENIYPRTHNYRINFQTPTEGFQHLLHFYHWSLVQNNIECKCWRNQIGLLSRVCKDACTAFNRFTRRIKPGAKFMCFVRRIKKTHSSDFSSRKNHLIPLTNYENDEDSIDLSKLETSLYVPNAVELHDSSTSFRRLWGSDLDIVFHPKIIWPSATMHISPLHIFDYSSAIFKHLIKFEQKYRMCGFHVTGYMTCIARLLQSKEDVNLLRKKSILPNTMKNDLEILAFVQEIRVETRGGRVPLDLRKFYRRVTKYHDGKLNRAYGGFKHHYCPNPWITLSVFGGVSLFILTLIQTIYTIIGNKKH